MEAKMLNGTAALQGRTVYAVRVDTTGLDPATDEPVRVCIADAAGDVFSPAFDCIFRPVRRQSWPDAERASGIAPEHVRQAPAFGEKAGELNALLAGADGYVFFNAGFDIGVLRAAGAVFRHDASVFDVMRDWSYRRADVASESRDVPWKPASDLAAGLGLRLPGADLAERTEFLAKAFRMLADQGAIRIRGFSGAPLREWPLPEACAPAEPEAAPAAEAPQADSAPEAPQEASPLDRMLSMRWRSDMQEGIHVAFRHVRPEDVESAARAGAGSDLDSLQPEEWLRRHMGDVLQAVDQRWMKQWQDLIARTAELKNVRLRPGQSAHAAMGPEGWCEARAAGFERAMQETFVLPAGCSMKFRLDLSAANGSCTFMFWLDDPEHLLYPVKGSPWYCKALPCRAGMDLKQTSLKFAGRASRDVLAARTSGDGCVRTASCWMPCAMLERCAAALKREAEAAPPISWNCGRLPMEEDPSPAMR